MTLSNARLQRDGHGEYWLHVRSEGGWAASLNLSQATGDGEITRKALEAWASEQIEQAKKKQPSEKL